LPPNGPIQYIFEINTASRENYILGSCKGVRIVVVLYGECVGVLIELGFYPPPEFPEAGKTGCPHPDNEVFILWVYPLFIE
jgi:hypothetical protein